MSVLLRCKHLATVLTIPFVYFGAPTWMCPQQCWCQHRRFTIWIFTKPCAVIFATCSFFSISFTCYFFHIYYLHSRNACHKCSAYNNQHSKRVFRCITSYVNCQPRQECLNHASGCKIPRYHFPNHLSSILSSVPTSPPDTSPPPPRSLSAKS